MSKHHARADERGSAFLLALIVIVLLTILGVSIVLVTETESALGHTEKTVDRQFYAAETGLWSQIVSIFIANNCLPERVAVPKEPDTGVAVEGLQFAHAVQNDLPVSAVNGCPPWTDCGEDLSDEDRVLMHFFLLSSTAQRVAVPSSTVYDPDTASTFESPFVPGAFDTTTGVNSNELPFNFKPGVEVLGEASIHVGLLAGPLRGQLRPAGGRIGADCARNTSGAIGRGP